MHAYHAHARETQAYTRTFTHTHKHAHVFHSEKCDISISASTRTRMGGYGCDCFPRISAGQGSKPSDSFHVGSHHRNRKKERTREIERKTRYFLRIHRYVRVCYRLRSLAASRREIVDSLCIRPMSSPRSLKSSSAQSPFT